MDFLEVIKQAREVLKSGGRITYRTLKRQFTLDDEALEDLKLEGGQGIAGGARRAGCKSAQEKV